MKIISNTKDFYDYVAHELGIDNTLRYVRAPLRNNGDEEVSLELPQHVVNAYLADTNSEFFTHVEERQYRFRSNTYWQVCSLVDLPRLKVPIFIGGRVFIAWANSNIDTQIIARGEVECPDWLNEIAKVLNTPVFVINRIHRRLSVNDSQRKPRAFIQNAPPDLGACGIPQHVDAISIYSAIQTWLENNRNTADLTTSADNNTRILAAGFDLKTSFRKR